VPRELDRQRCRDEDGNRYTVIVYPGQSSTFYTLDNGTPVLRLRLYSRSNRGAASPVR
jgi:hypothetical protein